MPFSLSYPFRPRNWEGTSVTTPETASSTVNEGLPYGLTTFSEGFDPVLDIVAVHGLDGHREKSWTVSDVNWLRDFLPTEIPHARIMSWGYDARTHSLSHIGGKYIYDHGKTLISDLCLKRNLTKTARRPIIFVAHSLGGIVLKSALIHSETARKGALEEHQSIKLSTYGILFMGSPHQGAAGVNLGELVLRIASVFISTDRKVVKHIKLGSEWLEQQLQQYASISQDFVTKFAYETLPTMSIAMGKKILIVSQVSAVVPGTPDGEPIAIAADHINMVKFASHDDVSYRKVSGHLQVMAERASVVIGTRWNEQDRIGNVLTEVTNNFSMPFSLYGVPEAEEFVGRVNELSQMEEAFHGDGSVRRIVVLQGLGGIGKTQLAVQYLKTHKDTYSAIFWLNGRTEDTLKQSFVAIAKRLYRQYKSSTLLETTAEGEDMDKVVKGVREWLSTQENHRWMLVFDNIDNPKMPDSKDSQAYDIRSYFPEAYHGSIIVTTRSSGLKVGRVISVRKLQDIEESITILKSTSGRPNLDQDPHTEKLALRLDGLPLALATAGAYLSQVSTSLEQYIRYYAESWLKLQKTSPELLSYEDRTLYSTWNLSLEHIRTQNESAALLLRLWAYLDNNDVWYDLLAAGKSNKPQWFSDIVQDELSFNDVIRLLCDHGLVEPPEGPDRQSRGYGMHSCVHSWCKYVLGKEDNIAMGRIVLSCVGASIPGTDYDSKSLALERRLLPHANMCVEVVQMDLNVVNEKNIEYLNDISLLGRLLRDQDRLKEAEVVYQRALKGQEKVLGPQHLSTLDTVHHFGVLYRRIDKLKDSEVMYQWALKGREEALGPDHPSTLDTVISLGILYKNQGRLKEAETMYHRALEGTGKSLGSEHKSTLDTLNNLGALYHVQGRQKEAEVMLRRALYGYENSLGPEHISALDTVHNLAMIYSDQGRLKEAEIMYQRVLDGTEKALGPEHTATLDTVYNLGNLYRNQGKLNEAEVLYIRALDGSEKSVGPEHTSTLDTIQNLGLIYRARGRLNEAEAMLKRALDGTEKALGPEHTSTLDAIHNLGNLYMDQGKLNEAEVLYIRALDGTKNSLGPEHPSTLFTVNNLAVLYQKQGKLKEAECMYRWALEGKEKALGLTHKTTLNTMYFFSGFYEEQGKYEEAETLMRRAVEGHQQALGPEHPYTLDAVERLAKLCRIQGRTEEADALLSRAEGNDFN